MSKQLIDTHAHLDDARFQADLPAVLERARCADVASMIAIATTAATSAQCIRLAAAHEPVFASVGIQPNHVAQEPAGAWDHVVDSALRPKVVAVGETGLDRHWNYTPFAQQQEFFARHLELGRRLNLAVVIHCREAEADTVRMLREDFDKHGPHKAVMHSFTGDLATTTACLEMGLYISFAGMLTYKSAGELRKVAATVPLDRLLVETDSPYLAPVPLRGQRNEPANVVHTAACLAGVLGVTPEKIAETTTANARALFAV